MKNLNKNKLVNRAKATLFTLVKLAVLFAVSFAVEGFVTHLLAGLNFAVAEFLLNEVGNTLTLKVLLKLALFANHFFHSNNQKD